MGKILGHVCMVLMISMSAAGAALAQVSSEENRPEPNQEDIQGQFKISVDVNLVSTDVTVIGAGASPLGVKDFIIYDNNIAQELTHFSYDSIPLAIALLIDRSGSVSRHMPMLKLAALLSLRHLRTEDRIALFAFDRDCSKLIDLTHDRLLIAEKINEIAGSGGTDIHKAICETARYLRKEAPDHRRAIILVSDNCHGAHAGAENPEKARVEMLETSATLYSIRIPKGDSVIVRRGSLNSADDWCSESNNAVKSITEETGGALLTVGASSSLQKSLETAILNLRHRYTLGFNPKNPGKKGSFHRVAVRLAVPERCPGCQLLARRGYFAGISSDAGPPKAVRSSPPDFLENTDEVLIQRSLLTAASFALDLPDIPFTAKINAQNDPNNKSRPLIDFHIDSSDIEIKKAQYQYAFNLDVAVFYADKAGEILDYDWRKYAGMMSKEAYDQFMEDGIQGSIEIPQAAQVQALKIVVYDEESNKIGSKLIKIPE